MALLPWEKVIEDGCAGNTAPQPNLPAVGHIRTNFHLSLVFAADPRAGERGYTNF